MVGAHINFNENVIVYNHGYYGFLDNKADFWNKKTDESFNNFVSFVMENYQQVVKIDYILLDLSEIFINV